MVAHLDHTRWLKIEGPQDVGLAAIALWRVPLQQLEHPSLKPQPCGGGRVLGRRGVEGEGSPSGN